MSGAAAAGRRLARLPIVAFILALSSAWACAPVPPAGDEATFRELEQRLADAWVRGDRRFIEGLLADDWSVTDPSGRIATRQQVLEETFGSADRRIEAMSIDDVKVRRLGSVAVVTGRTQAVGSYRGERAAVTLRFTDVFDERDGRWQIVASQGTAVAPSSAGPRE
jgi:ketosteroid isomerase-like protein